MFTMLRRLFDNRASDDRDSVMLAAGALLPVLRQGACIEFSMRGSNVMIKISSITEDTGNFDEKQKTEVVIK